MIEALQLAFAPLVGPITSALVHFLWQGSAIALVLAAILLMQRRSSASVRYRTACVALLLMIALPIATVAVYDAPAQQTISGTTTPGSLSPTPVHVSGVAINNDAETLMLRLPTLEALRPWVFSGWLVGVLVLSLINLIGWHRVQRLKREGTSPVPDDLKVVAERLSRRLRLSRTVRVLKSTVVEVPTVIGWLSPVVLIPVGALTGMSAGELRAIIAHELAHVQRRDYLVNILQVFAETVLFFHPAVWWVSRRVRVEREHCCDDIAVGLAESRRGYARALVSMEELRITNPQFAMRADGGSLSARIRRLSGGNKMKGHEHRPRISGVVMTVLLLLSAFLLTVPTGELVAESEAGDATHSGRWELGPRKSGDRLQLELEQGKRRGDHHMSFGVEAGAFTLTGDDSFELRREAGTFYFAGEFDTRGGKVREGDGEYRFVPDGDYEDKLKNLGVRGLDDDDVFVLAAMDMGSAYVKELNELGYDRIPSSDLVAMSIHRVQISFVRGMKELGFKHVSLGDHIAMRIHGVDMDYVEAMAEAGYESKSTDQLVAWRIHGVSPEFVGEMNEIGFKNLSSDDLTAMRIHKVTPEFARAMAELGYDHVDSDELVAWRIHGVSPEFVREMKDAGVSGLDSDDLTAFRIHGVSPKLAREIRELGFDDITAAELVALRIHQVSAKFIKKVQKKGLKKGHRNLSIDDLVELKIHGIDFD